MLPDTAQLQQKLCCALTSSACLGQLQWSYLGGGILFLRREDCVLVRSLLHPGTEGLVPQSSWRLQWESPRETQPLSWILWPTWGQPHSAPPPSAREQQAQPRPRARSSTRACASEESPCWASTVLGSRPRASPAAPQGPGSHPAPLRSPPWQLTAPPSREWGGFWANANYR